jgi:hypothetical protein
MHSEDSAGECYVCASETGARACRCLCVDRQICDSCLLLLVHSRSSTTCPVCLGEIEDVFMERRRTRSVNPSFFVSVSMLVAGLFAIVSSGVLLATNKTYTNESSASVGVRVVAIGGMGAIGVALVWLSCYSRRAMRSPWNTGTAVTRVWIVSEGKRSVDVLL